MGGAIYFFNNLDPKIINSLFVENEAQGGGAVYHDASGISTFSDLEVVNSIFVNNLASEGGSLHIAKRNGDEVEQIENNIFWDTNGRDNPILVRTTFGAFTPPNISNNIVIGGYEEEGSENNIDDDPQFVDPDNNDFRLQLNSPGIDAGNNDPINLDTDFSATLVSSTAP
ncbi:hypothetical protein Xen7305DRAFT_00047240 [Xenococcus sp. PCC 7305]|uniref:hypothetical protein n=1 Tax=Xenococcus sp. PCC 7305 TaxID=102125 RepID=UPI0002ABF635|nr:hypothetical protein [Xenococcus sp. PCC 7305]ELS04987.1 hypothetical protein Xen7305DRAFT_00047240 [Xenococcus sp. PCC 7305]